MALMSKPDEKIFASKAKEREVESFPDHNRGWGVSFEQTEGIPPMEWFNALFKRLDENILYVLQRGLPEWSATITYPKGAYVQYEGLSYKSLKETTNKQPNEANSEHWARWGLMASDLVKATLTQFGITQLFTGYDSEREDLALTPKTAKMLKALIDSNTRSLGNYIPNSKKSSAVDSPSVDTVATSAAVKTVQDNANGRVSRNGDVINWLIVEQDKSWFNVKSTNNSIAGVDLTVWGAQHPQVSVAAQDVGNFSVEHRFFNTPPGQNYSADRRRHVGTLTPDGNWWTLSYGWLHDFFCSQATFNEFRDKFQISYYNGSQSASQVYRIPLSGNKGIKIYATYLTILGGISAHRFRLAESLGGFRLGFAVNDGAARLHYGVTMESDTSVVIHCEAMGGAQGVNVLLIGEYHY